MCTWASAFYLHIPHCTSSLWAWFLHSAALFVFASTAFFSCRFDARCTLCLHIPIKKTKREKKITDWIVNAINLIVDTAAILNRKFCLHCSLHAWRWSRAHSHTRISFVFVGFRVTILVHFGCQYNVREEQKTSTAVSTSPSTDTHSLAWWMTHCR